jgi:hypothetical protein
MKLLLCLILAAFTASMFVTFQWETDVRRAWRELARLSK